jgi:hypothetical protein
MRGSVTGLHGPKTARSSCSRVRDPYFRGVYFEAHFVTNEIACTDEKPRAAYDPAGSETDRRLARTPVGNQPPGVAQGMRSEATSRPDVSRPIRDSGRRPLT